MNSSPSAPGGHRAQFVVEEVERRTGDRSADGDGAGGVEAPVARPDGRLGGSVLVDQGGGAGAQGEVAVDELGRQGFTRDHDGFEGAQPRAAEGVRGIEQDAVEGGHAQQLGDLVVIDQFDQTFRVAHFIRGGDDEVAARGESAPESGHR